jgi:protein-S-isoprenylcysteine O-methyltransferase Ste14
MHAIALLLCTTALGSFSWGMIRFFHTTSRSTPTCGVAVAGFASAVCHLYGIWTSTADWRSSAAASVLYLAAIGLFFWAIRSCGRQRLSAIFEADIPQCLVRDGPYRLLRHPFYVAYTLSWLAGWIASHSWLAFGSTVVMASTYVVAAAAEERKFRTSPMAAAHAAYCARTGFMLPRVWRLRRLHPDETR